MHNELPTLLPPTSLIIPSCNRPELLLGSVQSILQGDEVPSELIIIDQSSARHPVLPTLQTHRACEVQYIWTKSVGVSLARNTGIAAARYDILVFTDDDVLMPVEWFGTLVHALLNAGQHSIVTGRVQAHQERPGGFQLALKTDEMPTIYTHRTSIDVLYPLNMAMYKSTFAQVGNFDIRLGPGTPFPGAEDSDMGSRLLAAGYQIHYIPNAVLYHRAWRPAGDYVPLRWNYGVGRGGFYAKHLSLRDRYTFQRMLRDVSIHLVSSVHLFRRERRRAWGDAALAGGILFGAVRWLSTQRKA